MKHYPPITAYRAQGNPMLTVSDDGYIRLTYVELQHEVLTHLVSGLDEDTDNREGATTITGYTEWVSTSTPTISIGWDWQLGANEQLTRISEIRSNVMLHHNNETLEKFVDNLNWQNTVKRSIYQRYTD